MEVFSLVEGWGFEPPGVGKGVPAYGVDFGTR